MSKNKFRRLYFGAATLVLSTGMGISPISCGSKQAATGGAPSPSPSPGSAAALSVTVGSTSVPSTYDFGSVVHGSTSDITFTVTNSGGSDAASLAVDGTGPASPFSFAGGAYPGTDGSCGSDLAAGSTCTFVLTFAPASAAPFNSTLQLDFTGGNWSTALTGTGAPSCSPGALILSDLSAIGAGSSPIDDAFDRATRFTLDSAQTLTGVYLSINSSGPQTSGSISVTVYQDSGSGSPSATTVGNVPESTVDATTLPVGDPSLNQFFPFTPNLALAAGTYWISVSTSGIGGGNPIWLNYNGGSGPSWAQMDNFVSGTWYQGAAGTGLNFGVQACQ